MPDFGDFFPEPMTFKESFFHRHGPWAMETMKKSVIPASVTLAQAALESGWGQSILARNHNNYFGIKGKGPAGSARLLTWEVEGGRRIRKRAAFRKYNSPKESFDDHARVISTGRYLKHAMAHTGSARAFIEALQSKPAKYATDPDYVEKIMTLITQFDLERYDKKVREENDFV